MYYLYALIKNEKPIYIGVTTNVKARKNQHSKEKDFDRIIIIKEYEDKQLALCAENAIIRLNGIIDIGLVNAKHEEDIAKNLYIKNPTTPLNNGRR